MRTYLNELKFLIFFILSVLVVAVSSYSVFFFLDPGKVSLLGEEDQFFEWATFASLFLAAVFSLILFRKSRNLFFLLFFLLFLFGAGEEISWGQRVIGLETPESMMQVNVQEEFNIHNLQYFTQHTGIKRLLSANFMFRLFTLAFGIALPFLVYHFRHAGRVAQKLKIPVPPVTIGIFFLLNWVFYRFLHTSVLDHSLGVQYIDSAGEIFESVASFILFTIFFIFWKERNRVNMVGADIKESLVHRNRWIWRPSFILRYLAGFRTRKDHP